MAGFNNLIGHEEITGALSGMLLRGTISHAYLFAGPGGVGKTTAAFTFARALLCMGEPATAPCGACRSCRQFASGNHPDFHLVQPDGDRIKISQIRQLQQEVSLRPFQGARQVFVITAAEAMTREAANCFLATLEEPPAGVTFILVTDFPRSLLPTVASRCQCLFFGPLAERDVIQGLERIKGLKGEECRVVAALAGGSLGRALEILEKGAQREELLAWLEKLKGATPAAVLAAAGEAAGDKDNLERWPDMLMLWYRDILVWKKTGRHDLVINSDKLESIIAEAERLPARQALQRARAAWEAGIKLQNRINPRLVLEDLFFTLAGY